MKFLYFIIFLMVSCSPQSSHSTNKEKEALKSMKSLGKTLKSELQKAAKVSLENALETCHIKASPLTKEISRKGIEVGRVSLRNRSPKNNIKPWMKETIALFHRGKIQSQYQVVSISEKEEGLLMPIKTQGLCLKCHGKNISPKIQTKIKSLYPNDKATGYQAGEIRGFFWAKYLK